MTDPDQPTPEAEPTWTRVDALTGWYGNGHVILDDPGVPSHPRVASVLDLAAGRGHPAVVSLTVDDSDETTFLDETGALALAAALRARVFMHRGTDVGMLTAVLEAMGVEVNDDLVAEYQGSPLVHALVHTIAQVTGVVDHESAQRVRAQAEEADRG